jgi:hypothetical protein
MVSIKNRKKFSNRERKQIRLGFLFHSFAFPLKSVQNPWTTKMKTTTMNKDIQKYSCAVRTPMGKVSNAKKCDGKLRHANKKIIRFIG